MKVFITGGSGFVGASLAEGLCRMGAEVTILTRAIRQGRRLPEGAVFLEGDPTRKGDWQRLGAAHDIIINMAGESIFQRWSKASKDRIRESRLLTTHHVVDAMLRYPREGHTLISTSAVGYYGFHGDEDLSEESPPGDDFLGHLSQEWEAEALGAAEAGNRVVICRFGIVLGKKGGALAEMLPIFRKGLGSPLGSGKQWISWIHEKDLAGIYLFLVGQTDFTGVVNCTSPNPVTNRELTQTLAKVLGVPAFLPRVPAFLLKLKMGEMGTVLLNGQKVLPRKLLDLGYRFRFPTLAEALEDVLA